MLNPDYKEMLSLSLEEKVEFVPVGAYALAVHGFPRSTGGMDVFVNPTQENSRRVYRCLARFGAPLSGIEPDDFSRRSIAFQIGVAPKRIDIITAIDGVSFEEASHDAPRVDIEGMPIPVISKQKLVINKESTGRAKDRQDAEDLRRS